MFSLLLQTVTYPLEWQSESINIGRKSQDFISWNWPIYKDHITKLFTNFVKTQINQYP